MKRFFFFVSLALIGLCLFSGETFAQGKKYIYRSEVLDSVSSIKTVARLRKVRIGTTSRVALIDSIVFSANGDSLKFYSGGKKFKMTKY